MAEIQGESRIGIEGNTFASQQGETSNAPANSAGDQMLSGIETAVKKSANLTYRGGKKLAQTTARKVKEKREISRTLSEAKNVGGKTVEAAKDTASKIRTKNPAAKAVKGKPQKAVKTASRSMKRCEEWYERHQDCPAVGKNCTAGSQDSAAQPLQKRHKKPHRPPGYCESNNCTGVKRQSV